MQLAQPQAVRPTASSVAWTRAPGAPRCVLPSAGNGGTHDKCRRRWDLADAEFLKYKHLNAFDRAMCHLDKVSRGALPGHELWAGVGICRIR